MAQMTGNGSGRTRTMAEIVGYLFGAVYLLVGLIGFAITGGVEFAGVEGNLLLGIFEVNPLHNVVHLLIGAALIYGAMKGPNTARAINTVVGATYLLVGILGLFMTDSDVNILAINHADNVLHLVSAAILLTAGMMGPRTDATHAGTTTRTTSGTGTR
ncbi:MAG TPA: DUF4383 domain-containing protein [Frankiaceae bacterium]|nr:DUF4383 domain-containing protein [Frankiaceae bacterium]